MGAGQDLTVLNSFFLKSFLGLQFCLFFFSFTFIFLKSYENEQVDCSLQEWWRLTLLVLFPLGPPSGWRGGTGRRLPVNIWTWAGSGAGVERSQGSQAGEVSAPPDTGLGRLSIAYAPLPRHRIRQWLKPKQMPGKGVPRSFPAPRTRGGFKQGGLWQFLPSESLELRWGGGQGSQEQRE